MTFFVLLVGLAIGVWIWILQSHRVAQLIYSFKYLNIYRFTTFYEIFADSDFEFVTMELKGLASEPVSAKTHLKAVEMFRGNAYYAWRPYYYSEVLKIIEAAAIYLVLPALLYNRHIWVLLAGFIIGFGVPAASRQLMGTGDNVSLSLFYRFLGEKAYTMYGIKMVADEALVLETAVTATAEAVKAKNIKKSKKLKSSPPD